MRSLVVVVLVGAVLTSGCAANPQSDDVRPDGSSTSAAPPPEALPVGKSDLALASATTYLSPDGFSPTLQISVPADGWNSTHRSLDGFDVGQAVPGQDAALVVVAFLTPAEASAREALTSIEQAADSAGAQVAGRGTSTIRLTGGAGGLVQSRDAGIALDAVPGGYAEVVGTDGADGPLLTVTWVPDAANLSRAQALAGQLLAGVTPLQVDPSQTVADPR